MRIKILTSIAAVMVIASTSFATTSLYDSVTFTGYGAVQFGQIERGYSAGKTNYGSKLIANVWNESVRSRFSASFYKGTSMKINFGFEYNYNFFTLYPYTQGGNIQSCPPLTYYGDILIHRADMEYGFLNSKDFGLKLQLGYFPFKYNPQATNLGEYLFRSECYPNHIVNEFYFAETRLLGANLEATHSGTIAGSIPYSLKHNLLLTSEINYPTQDFSLSYLANADFFNDAFELGGGIEASRLLQVDPDRTTPHTVANKIPNNDSTAEPSYYTFAGTKVMARTCFDIKKIVPMNFLGKEELKIYGEWSILGLKNYAGYYEKISSRMPIVVGFNVPTFKLLDVLSCEAEYYQSPYFNDNWNQLYAYDSYLPATPNIITDQAYDQYHGKVSAKDHYWKWSVYAKRSLSSNFQIVAQAARDHERFQNPFNNQPYYLYSGDVTFGRGDWSYLVRLMWNF